MSIEKKGQAWWQPAMQMFAIVSGWIVGPILIALFLGSWLADKYEQRLIFFVSVGVAFVITNIGLIINVIKYSKQIEKESDLGKDKDQNK